MNQNVPPESLIHIVHEYHTPETWACEANSFSVKF